MNRLFAIILSWLAVITVFASEDQGVEKFEFAYGDTVRTYTMHLPQNLQAGAPVVVYAHGYGSKTRVRRDLNAVADANGFAVCYPDGAPDTRGNDGWYVGYPPQSNMAHNEDDFFKALLDEVSARFGLSRSNVFLAGFSNGGDLCYQLAYTRPDLFRAYASVAGLLFEWVYLGNKLTMPVPFLEIHGDADKTSMWQGDHAGAGGWGAYIPVPLAVSSIAVNNRCTTMQTDTVPLLADSLRVAERTVYSGAPSGKDVVVYRVNGAKHSWHNKDLPTAQIIWDFFKRYIE